MANHISRAFAHLVGADGTNSGFNFAAIDISLILLLAAFLYYFIFLPVVFGPLSPVPGPIWCKLSQYYISYFNISLQRTDTIFEWHARYGPVLCIGPEEVSLATPSLMREIYSASGGYAKSKFFDQFVTYGERAVFAIRPYAAHRQRRKLVASFYHNVHNPFVEEFISERLDAVINQIDAEKESTSIDVYTVGCHYAFDNITRLLYGKSHCSHAIETNGEERRILDSLKKAQLWGPLQMGFPLLYDLFRSVVSHLDFLPTQLQANESLGIWSYDRASGVIASGRAIGEGEEDTLMHHLMGAKNPDGTILSPKYVASELYDNINAAQATVAITITYILNRLSENPIWQTKICDEMISLPKEANGFPSFANINSGPMLDAFIREVYRVNPGTGGHAERVVPDGGKVYNGIHVPGGVRISFAKLLISLTSASEHGLTMTLGPRDSFHNGPAP